MERFPHGATYAGKVGPEDLSLNEIIAIQKEELGYCEGHRVLYKKWALQSCFVPMVFEDGLGRQCNEWLPTHKVR